MSTKMTSREISYHTDYFDDNGARICHDCLKAEQ